MRRPRGTQTCSCTRRHRCRRVDGGWHRSVEASIPSRPSSVARHAASADVGCRQRLSPAPPRALMCVSRKSRSWSSSTAVRPRSPSVPPSPRNLRLGPETARIDDLLCQCDHEVLAEIRRRGLALQPHRLVCGGDLPLSNLARPRPNDLFESTVRHEAVDQSAIHRSGCPTQRTELDGSGLLGLLELPNRRLSYAETTGEICPGHSESVADCADPPDKRAWLRGDGTIRCQLSFE